MGTTNPVTPSAYVPQLVPRELDESGQSWLRRILERGNVTQTDKDVVQAALTRAYTLPDTAARQREVARLLGIQQGLDNHSALQQLREALPGTAEQIATAMQNNANGLPAALRQLEVAELERLVKRLDGHPALVSLARVVANQPGLEFSQGRIEDMRDALKNEFDQRNAAFLADFNKHYRPLTR